MITRQMRKRNAPDSDDEEKPNKYVIRGRGHFYSSWD